MYAIKISFLYLYAEFKINDMSGLVNLKDAAKSVMEMKNTEGSKLLGISYDLFTTYKSRWKRKVMTEDNMKKIVKAAGYKIEIEALYKIK